MVMCAYDEARGRGEKHSTAVQHAVDSVKQCNREMPVSQTEVKRILATWRPRGSRIILRFESKILTEEDIKRHCWIREQLAALQGKKGLKWKCPRIMKLHGPLLHSPFILLRDRIIPATIARSVRNDCAR